MMVGGWSTNAAMSVCILMDLKRLNCEITSENELRNTHPVGGSSFKMITTQTLKTHSGDNWTFGDLTYFCGFFFLMMED